MTQDERLAMWPRLATLPTTNAMLTLVMVLWVLTGFCALAFALLDHGESHVAGAAALVVPERWFQALEVFTGIVVVQFIGKRGTDSQLWRKKEKEQPKEEPSGGS